MKNHIKIAFLSLLSITACNESKQESVTSEEKKDSSAVITPAKTYNMKVGNLNLSVDPQAGARISSFMVNDKEILYTSRDNNNNWGSTFWPGPQNLWGWPPPAILDSQPYTDSSSEGNFTFVSAQSDKPKLSFKKTFSSNQQDTSFSITYTITNIGDSSIKVAPWEITRVPSGGIVFFPKGNGNLQGDLKHLIKTSKNINWFDYDSTSIPQGVPKLFADGAEGWIAYVGNDRNVLIKKFNDTPLAQKAPDPENEIHIYTEPANKYTEVEQQGPYTAIEPGKTLSWTVQWYARALPSSLTVKQDNFDLVDFVRKTIK